MLNVQKVRLRFIFARALYLCRLFSKKLMVKGFSEPTRTSVVLISSDVFAAQKLASGSVHGCTLPDRLFSKKLMVKGFSERTGMSVKLSSSEFAPQTRRWTVYTEVHCSTATRTSVVPYRSEFACKLVAQECTGRTFLGGDVRGSNQQRCFCGAKTRRQNAQGRAGY